MNNNIFVFRVDASEKIGLGHLVRCLIIAELIVSKGFEVVFYTAKSLSQNIIESRGFRCYRLGDTPPNLNELYNRFLVIADLNSDAIFKKTADYYDYLDILRVNAQLLLTLEDLIDYPYCSDIVVIPYCGANKLKLQSDCKSKYLLGSKYFLLSEEFKNSTFAVSKIATKILVTMGGSDPENITLKVLSSINKLPSKYSITIVLGKGSSLLVSDIDNFMSEFKGKYKILIDVKNISKIMLKSDVAITNSGLTKYELSALGIPSLIISNNTQQAIHSDEFSSNGSSLHLGHYRNIINNDIIKKCEDLMLDYGLRAEMSKKGKLMLDSNGFNRIWDVLSIYNKDDRYAKD